MQCRLVFYAEAQLIVGTVCKDWLKGIPSQSVTIPIPSFLLGQCAVKGSMEFLPKVWQSQPHPSCWDRVQRMFKRIPSQSVTISTPSFLLGQCAEKGSMEFFPKCDNPNPILLVGTVCRERFNGIPSQSVTIPIPSFFSNAWDGFWEFAIHFLQQK